MWDVFGTNPTPAMNKFMIGASIVIIILGLTGLIFDGFKPTYVLNLLLGCVAIAMTKYE